MHVYVYLLVCISVLTCVCECFQEWVRNLKANQIQPVFANPARQVVRLFEAARLPQVIGEEFISVRIHDAVTYCQELMAEGQDHTKLEKVTEEAESVEEHRREAHKLAGQTYIGPPV